MSIITDRIIEGEKVNSLLRECSLKQQFYESVIRAYTSPICARYYAERLLSERRAPVKSALDRFAETVPTGARVLDLGCGTGKDVAYLRGKSIDALGVDISSAMLQYAAELAGHDCFVRADFRDLRCFNLHSFHGILSLASLQHVFRSDIGAVLQQMHSLLRPDGMLLIITKEGHGIYLDNRLGEEFTRPTTLVTNEELQLHLMRRGLSIVTSSCFALEREGVIDNWIAVLARKE